MSEEQRFREALERIADTEVTVYGEEAEFADLVLRGKEWPPDSNWKSTYRES